MPKMHPERSQHRYQPRVVGEGSALTILPACSCGWTATRRDYDGAAKSVWKRHMQERHATPETTGDDAS